MHVIATQDGAALRSDAPFLIQATPALVRSSRRRIAFWTFFAIVAVMAMAAGVLTWQVIETVGMVNSASTPPAIVSGAVLGGSPEVQIDTGAARTAVAITELGLTETPAPTNTIIPTNTATATAEPTSTPEPSATATMINITADASPEAFPTTEPTEDLDLPTEIDVPIDNLTATPDPLSIAPTEEEDYSLPTEIDVPIDNLTATPLPAVTSEPVTAAAAPEATVLSEIERVENGSFEGGIAPWYVESGADSLQVDDALDGAAMLQVPAAGGYVDQSIFTIPGTTYYLSAGGRMTVAGDSGEVGVVYSDAQGTRLRDLEPEPITFKSTKFSLKGMTFSPPAAVAKVQVYAYKSAGKAAFQVDSVSVRSVIPPYIAGGAVDSPPALADGSMTILIMGVDAEDGEAIDSEVRPDSLMIVHLNPASSACRVLAIPRDTRTELPGYGLSKVNHALALGGIDYEVQVVSELTDLPIDHYVLIDFSGFEDLVDAIGGITVNVPETFTAIDGTLFQAGEQRLTGKQALAYSRYRGDSEGDFGRIKRQQQVIRALIRETGGLDVLTSIRELLPAVSDNLRTDLSVTKMVNMATTYRSICTEDAVTMLKLEGEIATFHDPLLKMPLSYVIVDEAEIRRKVASLLEP